VIENTLGVLHNIVYNEKPRKYPKTSEKDQETLTSGLMTSLYVDTVTCVDTIACVDTITYVDTITCVDTVT
jgi:hypothetical protein